MRKLALWGFALHCNQMSVYISHYVVTHWVRFLIQTHLFYVECGLHSPGDHKISSSHSLCKFYFSFGRNSGPQPRVSFREDPVPASHDSPRQKERVSLPQLALPPPSSPFRFLELAWRPHSSLNPHHPTDPGIRN